MAKKKPTSCSGRCSNAARIIDAVPVSVNADQPPPQMISNPVTAIKTHATNFDGLYANYNSLRNLAKPLNGLPQTDMFPSNVQITNIKIDYVLDGAQNTAQISKVNSIGEIAPLLAAALRGLIDDIRQELVLLDQTTAAVKNAVNATRSGQKNDS